VYLLWCATVSDRSWGVCGFVSVGLLAIWCAAYQTDSFILTMVCAKLFSRWIFRQLNGVMQEYVGWPKPYIYAPYMAVYLVISLPKIPYIHGMYLGFWLTLRMFQPYVCFKKNKNNSGSPFVCVWKRGRGGGGG